ncbi:hypothetical protein CKAN_00964400 [Cinnamomum micranthum f. kanehirae]|uniref:DUF7906 domain-containing protein n=1 Tax=Cinnamomum micranthum f. kanehirae TaxID=337451 RepID=A0A3S3MCE6_9MAGN|nr:hypothetical protein CKAN_00964400 [Cinnamomum micranthum f. kanehirae]
MASTSFFFFPSLLVFFLFSISTTISSAPILGLDSFLSHQSQIDPIASNDTFLSLPSNLKKFLSDPPPPSTSSPLLSLSISVPIHVILVGSFPSDGPHLLSSFLSSAHSSDLFHVISSSPSQSQHHLSVRHSLHLHPSSSPPSLSSQLFAAIASHLSSSPSPLRSSFQSVPYSIVDRLIKQDFDARQPARGVHIYLLNLGSQSKPYAYSYTDGDSSPAFTRCSGTLWTAKDRYLWIDLGAGPVDYGPAISGDGLLPRGEFHSLAALHGRPKSNKALFADAASLIWSAYQVLLVPSLRIPVYFENSLLVQFIHVYGSDGRDSRGLDWNSIEKTFMDEVRDGGLVFGVQSLQFKKYEVAISQCPLCSFAISRSMNFYTSRFLFDNYTLIVSEYLDSKRLHQILSDSAEGLKRSVGIQDEEFGTVLPVYVFDLDYDKLLLLDRYHQVVAFKDMVIAVRTRSAQTVSDYNCNGRHVITQTRELERPLVGSILQSMWGVSPTHLSWSPRHNSTLLDYTWSVGQTPFGPFSELMSLSFVQKDAAKRNILLTALNYTITSGVEVLDSIAFHGGHRRLLRHNRHVEFVQRWNLFEYKLNKVISAMSHLDYDQAFYFLKSSDHDLYAIHSLVYQASQELEASLVCFKDPPFPWVALSTEPLAVFFFIHVFSLVNLRPPMLPVAMNISDVCQPYP